MKIIDNKLGKKIESESFNMVFNKENGFTAMWGKTKDSDPEFCSYGPVIADIEISTICNKGCAFCYKSITGNGKNMSFETFKNIFHKFPQTLTQIAFGIGDINANPDLCKIFKYCKENDYQYIVPNVTINGANMDSGWYDFLAETCGAVAVSYYNENDCFNAVKELTDRGMKQVNIHCMLSEETYRKSMGLIEKVKTDPRLKQLNAVVFLMLKQKGRGEGLTSINDLHYHRFVTTLFNSKINFGFDSCGSGRLLKFGVDKEIEKFIEPCESGLFSSYFNTDGHFFPCSFMENVDEWNEGIDLTQLNNFNELWMHEKVIKWKNDLISNCRQCPKYKI